MRIIILYKYNPKLISEEWLYWSAFIIGAWFWFDKKLLYFKNQFIISLLLCLMFLFIVVIVVRQNFIAPIPLASVIGRIIVNKKLDKIRKIDLEAKDEVDDLLEGRAKLLIYSLTTVVITCIINLIIKLVI